MRNMTIFLVDFIRHCIHTCSQSNTDYSIGEGMKLRYLAWCVLLLLCSVGVVSAGHSYSKLELLETSTLCSHCHTDMAATLENSLHRITEATDMTSTITIGCVGCHDGWEEHVEDPSPENIETAARLSFSGQVDLCSRCHITPHQSSMVSSDPHGRLEIGCIECHSVHSNVNEHLVKDDGDNYCAACHTSVAAEFKRRSAHPLESGNVRCVDCHKLGENEDHLLAVGLDWS